jgi:hypothetical protein
MRITPALRTPSAIRSTIHTADGTVTIHTVTAHATAHRGYAAVLASLGRTA